MMTTLQNIGRQALRGALEVRYKVGAKHNDPICVYDLAEKLGVEVRFVGGSSFEGMYSRSTQTVLVPSMRPLGRQRYACGHELGHWYFDHGTTVEDFASLRIGKHLSLEDQLANTFASCLLAPSGAVKEIFRRRSWSIEACTPLQLYIASNQLGMGYQTLVNHLQYSLRLISTYHAGKLLTTSPKAIRKEILGVSDVAHLVIADEAWTSVAIDLQVGDSAIIPANSTIDGDAVSEEGCVSMGKKIHARRPGIARVYNTKSAWASYIRVSRKAFEGRAIYRHLEDPDVD